MIETKESGIHRLKGAIVFQIIEPTLLSCRANNLTVFQR